MGFFNTIKNIFDYREFIGFHRDDTAPSNPNQNLQPTPEATQQGQSNENLNKQVLFTWTAQNKLPHSGLDPKLKRSLMIIGIVVGILLFIMQEYLLILAIGSLVFVSYVISNTPASIVTHDINNLGVSYEGEFYPYTDLKFYFFTQKGGVDILGIDRQNYTRLIFLINPNEKQVIHELLYTRIPYLETPPQDALDDMYKGILSRFTTS